jgi:hypothetical protein
VIRAVFRRNASPERRGLESLFRETAEIWWLRARGSMLLNELEQLWKQTAGAVGGLNEFEENELS